MVRNGGLLSVCCVMVWGSLALAAPPQPANTRWKRNAGSIISPKQSASVEVCVGGDTEAGCDTFLGADGVVVVNEQGNDSDTRFEGDAVTNLFGTDASTETVVIGTATGTTSQLLRMSREIDAATTSFDMVDIFPTYDPTAEVTAQKIGLGVQTTVKSGNAQDFNASGLLAGTVNNVQHNGTGTITITRAYQTKVNNSSSGTLTTVHGNLVVLQNLSTGTITTGIGQIIQAPVNSGGGTFTTFTGLQIDTPTAAGTNFAIVTKGGAIVLNEDGGSHTTRIEASGFATALQVNGADGVITLGGGTVNFGSTAQDGVIIIHDDDAGGDATVTIQALDATGTAYTLTLPPDDGDADEVLKTNGSGVMDWVAQTGGGGWTDDGTEVRLDTSTDEVEIGSAGTLSAKLGINGDADEVQVHIQGHSTQTNDLVLLEQSDGTDLMRMDNLGHMISHDDAGTPALSSCGSSPTITGSDFIGSVVIGGGGATVCTVTFSTTYVNTPVCQITAVAAASTLYLSAKSASAFTVTSSALTQPFDYTCVGLQ
jgi:hypothetical protein